MQISNEEWRLNDENAMFARAIKKKEKKKERYEGVVAEWVVVGGRRMTGRGEKGPRTG